jgi:hypothetical protein
MHDAFKKNTKEDSLEDALLVSCNCWIMYARGIWLSQVYINCKKWLS